MQRQVGARRPSFSLQTLWLKTQALPSSFSSWAVAEASFPLRSAVVRDHQFPLPEVTMDTASQGITQMWRN